MGSYLRLLLPVFVRYLLPLLFAISCPAMTPPAPLARRTTPLSARTFSRRGSACGQDTPLFRLDPAHVHDASGGVGLTRHEVGRDSPIFSSFGQFCLYILTLWK